MGRGFESVRMGVKEVSERWLKASRALKKEDQVYGQKLAEMAKRHSGEASYYLGDPLEAAVFSVLVEMMKRRAEGENKTERLIPNKYTDAVYDIDWRLEGILCHSVMKPLSR